MAARTETGDLERDLAVLLEIDRFEPPVELRRLALWSDPAVYPSAKSSSSRRCSNGKG
jgi:hypothetical protein